MSNVVQPIFLFADSQLLFWRDPEGRPTLERARDLLLEGEPERVLKAVYLGASNGDLPEFYELFVAAMAEIGVHKTRQIPARPTPDDLEALDMADLILLAGGDPLAGWRAFREAGLDERIKARYYGGAVLVGISAGAMQLGLKAWNEETAGTGASVETLRLVPFLVDVHDEPTWDGLQARVQAAGELTRGYGIPSGGGALYHPDYSLEPVRLPVTEIELRGDELRPSLVLPGAGGEESADGPRILSEEEILEATLHELGAPHPGTAPGDDEPVN